jgi:site-specific DNA recombinase
VWNKKRKAEIDVDDDVALGHETKKRWNPTQEWVYSTTRATKRLSTTKPSNGSGG